MGCMTEDYKTILVEMITKNVPHNVLKYVVDTIPLCPVGGPAVSAVKKAVEKAKREVPPRWPEPDYIDENGVRKHYSSVSKLIETLGLEVTGKKIVCELPEGGQEECTPATVIEILRLHGYTVEGDGEPAKLVEGGKVLTVIHPAAIKKGSPPAAGAGPLGGAFGMLPKEA